MKRPAILLTSYVTGAADGKNLGVAGYSYDIVAELFLPLLRRWGEVITVQHPHRDLDAAAEAARRRGLEPIHVSFRPFQDVCLSQSAPNVVVPAWEFPDVPNVPFGGNPQNDWPATANRCSLVLVGGEFTRRALLKAGTTTPIRIVQVPTPHEYFELPAWGPGKPATIDCSGYEFCHPIVDPICEFPIGQAPRKKRRAARLARARGAVLSGARRTYKRAIRPLLSQRVAQTVAHAWKGAKQGWRLPAGNIGRRADGIEQLDLSGIVYTSILNPIDGRKNWQDLLTGFLLALGDREDATLVVKLITSGPDATARVLYNYEVRDIPHRCKLVFIADYLTDEQLHQLAGASTYYLQTTKAEGNCLPLMNYLAAGRPGISPEHSAIGDYFDDEIGFVVESHAEPSAWPHDPRLRVRTTWNRIVWTSLVQQIRKSYTVAKNDRSAYGAMSQRGRTRMRQWAAAENIWPRLKSALDLVAAEASVAGKVPPWRPRAAA